MKIPIGLPFNVGDISKKIGTTTKNYIFVSKIGGYLTHALLLKGDEGNNQC